MQAQRIIFAAPHEARLEPFEAPKKPGANELLLKARVTAISPGTELIIYTGRHTLLSVPNAPWPKFPFRPGYSSVAEVVAVGEQVSGYAVSQRVYTGLAHCSWGAIDPSKGGATLVPESVPDEEAALGGLAAIGLNGVRLARIALGETVIVGGLGLIGLFAAQLARAAGAAQVVGVDLLPSRRDVARQVGVEVVLDPTQESLRERALALTEGRGADVIVDATGSPKAVPGMLGAARRFGRYIVLGSPHGTVEMDLYREIHGRCLQIIGAHNNSTGDIESPFARWSSSDNLALIMQFIVQGRLHVKELITDVVKPQEAGAVYERLAQSHAESLGVVFDWR